MWHFSISFNLIILELLFAFAIIFSAISKKVINFPVTAFIDPILFRKITLHIISATSSTKI